MTVLYMFFSLIIHNYSSNFLQNNFLAVYSYSFMALLRNIPKGLFYANSHILFLLVGSIQRKLDPVAWGQGVLGSTPRYAPPLTPQ